MNALPLGAGDVTNVFANVATLGYDLLSLHMTTLKAGRELWNPETEADRQLVLRELQTLLESPQFCNSRRYPKFLRYVVERTLEGAGQQLKERTIGVEVFGRPADYDTNADTIVRFTAGEVRKRLALYNHDHEASAAVQFTLPTGSYIPEFLLKEHEEARVPAAELLAPQVAESPGPAVSPAAQALEPVPEWHTPAVADPKTRRAPAYLATLLVSLGLVLVVATLSFYAGRRGTAAQTEVDRYWAPLFAERSPVLLGSGGTVISPERYPGPTTADRTTEYPFVSMQIVNAILRITEVFERRGAPYELRSAPFLTLTDLRERPTVLVGGYNNEWTMRLVSPLRFYFAPGSPEAILDHERPSISWHRDPQLPYASADDYALVARFLDPTTDSTIYIVAGIGRNGTEAAAQFVTTPHYLEMLNGQAGAGWMSKNIEAVIKTHVINGRTGAPSVIAVHTW